MGIPIPQSDENDPPSRLSPVQMLTLIHRHSAHTLCLFDNVSLISSVRFHLHIRSQKIKSISHLNVKVPIVC